jgi:hypothetical protein
LLLDQHAEAQLRKTVNELSATLAVILTGKPTPGFDPSIVSRFNVPHPNNAPFLTQSFIAGKIANSLGVRKSTKMSADQVTQHLQSTSFALTDTDRAELDRLNTNTLRFIANRSDAWNKRISYYLENYDREWGARLLSKENPDLEQTRLPFINGLVRSLSDLLPEFQGEAHRLVHTESSTYFQYGQVMDVDQEEMIYKVPSSAACAYCQDLCNESDGSPKLYKLGDVRGNSNIGVRAADWRFTVGPFHPSCYCVLYTTTDTPPTTEPLAREHSHLWLQTLRSMNRSHRSGLPTSRTKKVLR